MAGNPSKRLRSADDSAGMVPIEDFDRIVEEMKNFDENREAVRDHEYMPAYSPKL